MTTIRALRSGRALSGSTITLAFALLLVGCPTPDQDTPPATPPGPPIEAPAPDEPLPDEPAPPPNDIALEQSCTNTEFGFQVDYPAGWVVNDPDGLPPCSAFDPEDTGMPAAGEIPAEIAIVIHRDQVPFARVMDFDGDFTVDVVWREEATVDGRRAVVAELEHTGQGMYPAGQRQYVYYVDVEPHTLIGVTHDLEAADPPSYQERRRTLDAMMTSLRFQDPG